jgi:hypothetical protein
MLGEKELAMSAHDVQEPAKSRRWTVMLYMAASQDERTEQAAIRDLKELEKVGSDDSTVNVLVQIDRQWPGYAERYWIKKHPSQFWEPLRTQRNIDSGKPEVLRDFVKWGRTSFPADYYLLVLWGHSYGLGFGRDHGNALTLPEIASSLNVKALRELGVPIADGRMAVDILGANACAMSYAEAAYELQDAADFLVAPEIAMPFAGWPYEEILTDIVKTPDIKPARLGEIIVERFVASFATAFEPRSVALTLLDLKKAKEIKVHLNALTNALRDAVVHDGVRQQIGDAFLDTAHGEVRPLIDLFDLCERLKELSAAPNVVNAAEKFSGFLTPGQPCASSDADRSTRALAPASPTVASGAEAPPEDGKFVLRYKGSPELEGLHGVGIYAPSVTGAADLMRLEFSRRKYRELRLLKDLADPDWAKFVYKDLKDVLHPLNKVIAEFVRTTGATGIAERTGVAQLLVGVYQSFVKLQRTLGIAQDNVMSTLDGNGASTRLMAIGQQYQAAVAARFSPPYLRLATDLPQSPPVALPQTQTAFDTDPGFQLMERVAQSLEKLEDALANVERTAKRVTTHASLGLGVPKDDLGVPKDDLGVPKDDLGVPKDDLGVPKDDLGVPKDDLGLLAALFAADGHQASASNGNLSVTDLYRLIALSLQLVEGALGRTEDAVRAVLTSSALGRSQVDQKYRQRVTEQLKGSFQEVQEAMTNAMRTAGEVLANPANGLGPTPQSRGGTISRHQLAIIGGLSSQTLRLL